MLVCELLVFMGPPKDAVDQKMELDKPTVAILQETR